MLRVMDKRLYVIVDKSLEPVYGCVQGGHCLIRYVQSHDIKLNNETLVYLYGDIKSWINKLNRLGIEFSVFEEPDLNYMKTSIVIEGHDKLFKKLKLIK